MNDAEIRDRIAELDALVPTEGAVVELDQYGGGADESRIRANKQGYLRIGIELLKGAYLAQKDGSSQIAIDLDYLLSDDSSVWFDWFERTEDVSLERCESAHSGRIAGVGCLVILVIAIALALVGLFTVTGWIVNHA